jgi:hypothetical protein
MREIIVTGKNVALRHNAWEQHLFAVVFQPLEVAFKLKRWESYLNGNGNVK